MASFLILEELVNVFYIMEKRENDETIVEKKSNFYSR